MSERSSEEALRGSPAGGEEAVKVEGLTKTYPGFTEPLQILQGIDLTIYKGEIIAIVGQSGSGKSTLLHILGTIDRPTSGSVRFGDQNPFELSAEELAKFRRRSIGFVFQFHNLLPEFTALENVMLPMEFSGGTNGAAPVATTMARVDSVFTLPSSWVICTCHGSMILAWPSTTSMTVTG
jgi:lipoprotein-releasing system ATP-binding protein